MHKTGPLSYHKKFAGLSQSRKIGQLMLYAVFIDLTMSVQLISHETIHHTDCTQQANEKICLLLLTNFLENTDYRANVDIPCSFETNEPNLCLLPCKIYQPQLFYATLKCL